MSDIIKEPEYQELKKHHIKEMFDKVFNDGYSLVVECPYANYYFKGGVSGYDKKVIIEGEKWFYSYKDFEKLICKLDKYTIDEEEKFIVVFQTKERITWEI